MIRLNLLRAKSVSVVDYRPSGQGTLGLAYTLFVGLYLGLLKEEVAHEFGLNNRLEG